MRTFALAAAVGVSLFAGGGCLFGEAVDRTMLTSALMRPDARDAHRDLASEIGVASATGGESEVGVESGVGPVGGVGVCPT